MPKIFKPALQNTKTPLASTLGNFSDAITASKARTADYRNWSEKATVVAYDEALDAYDIVVNTIFAGDNGVRSSNRIIRGVRSIIPSDVTQFSAGQNILIGYMQERRESPIILGLHKQKQSDRLSPPKTIATTPVVPLAVYLRPNTDTTLWQGFTTPVLRTPATEIPITCSEDGVEGSFSVNLEVTGAVGPVTWKLTSPYGGIEHCFGPGKAFSITQDNASTQAGTQVFTFNKAAGVNNYGTTVSHAFHYCYRYEDSVSHGCAAGQTTSYRDCSSVERDFDDCIQVFGGTCAAAAAAMSSICAEPYDQGGSCPACTKVDSLPSCLSIVEKDPGQSLVSWVTENGFSDMVGQHSTNFDTRYSNTASRLPSQDTLIDMRKGGCCPCEMISGASLIVTDSLNRTLTLPLGLNRTT